MGLREFLVPGGVRGMPEQGWKVDAAATPHTAGETVEAIWNGVGAPRSAGALTRDHRRPVFTIPIRLSADVAPHSADTVVAPKAAQTPGRCLLPSACWPTG